jgi:hypothetical protein
VKADFLRAGFKLEGTSDILRNPADDHSLNVVRSEDPWEDRPLHLQVPQAAMKAGSKRATWLVLGALVADCCSAHCRTRPATASRSH